MEKKKEYDYPPIPTIQLAKFANLKMKHEGGAKTNRTENFISDFTPNKMEKRTFSLGKESPIKQNTLNGMQSNL